MTPQDYVEVGDDYEVRREPTRDPAEGSVLVRCPDCDTDLQVWPDPAYPLVPDVVCDQGHGTHILQWATGRRSETV